MNSSIEEFLKKAREYVEIESDAEVESIEFVRNEESLYGVDSIAVANLTEGEESECWVIGGTTPMNLYAKSTFDNPDEAFSFHLGIVQRLAQQELNEKSGDSDGKGYDAFICHASEDKEPLVHPLAEELRERGLRIWYDEFELDIGDSLRRSIDRGLSESIYGIVVLSDSFFGKDWTEYELDGLTARETQQDKVILPVWYNIGKEEVIEYSPPLADKVAVRANKQNVEETAEDLYEAIMNDAVQKLSDYHTSKTEPVSKTETPPSSGLDEDEVALQNEMIRRDYRDFFENPMVHFIARQPNVRGAMEEWDAEPETIRKVWKISTDDGFYHKRKKSWQLSPKGVDRAEELGEEILLDESVQDELLDYLLEKYRDNPMESRVQREELIEAGDYSANEIDHNIWLLDEKGYVNIETFGGDSRGYSLVEITNLGRRVTE